MIKSELISNIAQQMTDLPEYQIADAVNCVVDLLGEALSDNQRIEIRGFGSFALRHRKPRQAHNPKTGEKLMTQDKHSAHFKPGKELRDRVNVARLHCPILQKHEDDDRAAK